jgi:hypothetical protein
MTYVLAGLAVLCLAAVLLLSGCSSNRTERVSLGAASEGEGGYTCPLTGEQLPCPKCCPLNNNNNN